MFSQALRDTTYCKSTSLQLASLASSFTPCFNLFHREANARRELGIFCVVQHSPEAQQRYLQAAVADYDLFKPSSLQDTVACFFFQGGLQNGEIFHELSFVSFPASASFGENFLEHDLIFF